MNRPAFRLFCFFFLLFSGWSTYAQQSYTDSLWRVIRAAPADSNQVKRLNELGWELKFDHPDSARQILSNSLQLARSLNFLPGIGDALNYRGVVEDIHGEPDLAVSYFRQALVIRDSLDDQKGVASMYNNIGNVRENLGDFTDALANYLNSLRIREELRDTSKIMRLYYNISIVHESIGNYPEALDFIFQYLELVEATQNEDNLGNAYNVIGNIKTELDRTAEAFVWYKRALVFHRNAGNKWEESTVLNNMANVLDYKADSLYDEKDFLEALKQTEKSLELYEEALSIREDLDDLDGQAEIFNNIGLTYKNRGTFFLDLGDKVSAEKEWELALELFEQAEEIWTESNNKQGILQLYNGYGDVYRRQEKYELALEYINKSLALSKEVGDLRSLQNVYKDLSRIYAATGAFEKAFEFRKLYDEVRYDRINEKQVKDNERREIMYSDRKKQYEIERQQQAILLQEADLKQARIRQYSLIGGAVGLLLMVFLLVNRNRIKTRANHDLAEKNDIIELERQRSEELLLNILPASTAEELKSKGKADARSYDQVSVLFTDFKSFTTIAESLSAEELVGMLDECFRAYDRITSRYGIEKIKTIGDSYMCASGLPEPLEDHASRILKAALDIRAWMEAYSDRRRKKNLPLFEVRIGIHSGPVVAGVVGNKKFAYDIWGDTVNLAARMEASGEPGKVNVSEATYQLVSAEFESIDRGLILAKGKGEQQMYFIEDRRTSFDLQRLRQDVLKKLEKGLSPQLVYHSLSHILDVEQAALEICKEEGIHQADVRLVQTAALLHDIGFLEQAKDHELIGCRIARELLPGYNYTDSEIEQICRMILATRVPQVPEDHLSAILCDADLDYLGREDYESISTLLFKELNHRGDTLTDASWQQIQIGFLEVHQYHTTTNIERRKPEKERRLQLIRQQSEPVRID
ncbi:MAG: tetratricopeptide repeat protein [Saprospiraceae bacterium]|nr:tetratricopeptide repeat protein [Saprospiraceae bacterium]